MKRSKRKKKISDAQAEELRRNAMAWRAHMRFLRKGIKRGIKIRDVYGKLDDAD